MIREIFSSWFFDDFATFVRCHLRSINLPQKSILFIDNAPVHQEDLI